MHVKNYSSRIIALTTTVLLATGCAGGQGFNAIKSLGIEKGISAIGNVFGSETTVTDAFPKLANCDRDGQVWSCLSAGEGDVYIVVENTEPAVSRRKLSRIMRRYRAESLPEGSYIYGQEAMDRGSALDDVLSSAVGQFVTRAAVQTGAGISSYQAGRAVGQELKKDPFFGVHLFVGHR